MYVILYNHAIRYNVASQVIINATGNFQISIALITMGNSRMTEILHGAGN
jgi:hypothetical protein